MAIISEIGDKKNTKDDINKDIGLFKLNIIYFNEHIYIVILYDISMYEVGLYLYENT